MTVGRELAGAEGSWGLTVRLREVGTEPPELSSRAGRLAHL